MKQNQIVFILQLMISGCMVGCSREILSRLDVAMDLAKGNCLQIERVLEHYRNDSFKREAALSLIENMPGHVSYADTMGARTLYDDLDEYLSRNVDRNYTRKIDCRMWKEYSWNHCQRNLWMKWSRI